MIPDDMGGFLPPGATRSACTPLPNAARLLGDQPKDEEADAEDYEGWQLHEKRTNVVP